jgi:hypothetical protein
MTVHPTRLSEEQGIPSCWRLSAVLEQQIVHVSIPAATSEQSFDVAVDGFNHPHRHLNPAVVQDPIEMIDQHVGQFLHRSQTLPAQLIDPTVQIAHHGAFVGIVPQMPQAFLVPA